ncbi:MAG TPA: hypothetical protein PLQ65_13810, partial [Flavihumibacter sp.]|nr:hypothetical protein [Flavihumibacter sp.]
MVVIIDQCHRFIISPAGRSRFWYDRLGRLVASQNSKQYYASTTEAGRKYSYTAYDALGRITEVGETSNAGSTAISQSLTRNATNWANWLTAASANRADITQTVYDAAYAGFTAGEQPLVQRNLRNRVSYTTITAGSNPAQFNTASFYSYDIHGNVDTLVQDYGSSTTGIPNLMNSNANRWKKLVYQYDLISGKVNQVNYNAGKADQFFHRYRYDGENRLQSVQTSNDGKQWEEDARYQYYLHGPLARTVLGQDQVQGLDYAYTLQGWLKGVNSATQREGLYDMGRDGQTGQPTQYVGRDAMGFQLTYYATDYQSIATGVTPFPNYNWLLPAGEFRALYNGNISGMAVNIGALNAPLLYNYRYDQLNRLVGMDSYTGLNAANNSWGTMSNSGAYKERIRYDGNGNILNVQRQGIAGNLSMDSLQYNYPRNATGQLTSNRLQWVRDAISSTAYADDIDNQSAGNYGYDSIGNLTRDDQAGITGIEWTVYGKIRKITKASGQTISYGYDAAGNRISKTVTMNGQTTYTWYVRDAQGNTLSTYGSSGSGSTIPSTVTQTDVHLYGSSRIGVMNRNVDAKQSLTTPDTTTIQRGWKFFELSNHLGNVLATVTDKKLGHTPDGINVDYYNADVVTVSDYYPFGMLMPGRQLGQGVNIPGVSSTGTTQVNGYNVPADMSVASRSG